jgi:hypothetical protein
MSGSSGRVVVVAGSVVDVVDVVVVLVVVEVDDDVVGVVNWLDDDVEDEVGSGVDVAAPSAGEHAAATRAVTASAPTTNVCRVLDGQ